VLVLVIAVVVGGCPRPDHVKMFGGGAGSDDLWVSSGDAVWREGAGGTVALAQSRKPQAGYQIPFLLFIKADDPKTWPNVTGSAACEGERGTIAMAITLGSDRVEVRYTLVAAGTETLAIDGKPYDVTAGRVFLIDLRGPSEKVTQRAVALPADVPRFETAEVFDAVVEQALAAVKQGDDATRRFIEGKRSS